MRVRRAEILPLAETAIREALRDAVREAIRDVSLEAGTLDLTRSLRNPAPAERATEFTNENDEEAWERFDSIRFARIAGIARRGILTPEQRRSQIQASS